MNNVQTQASRPYRFKLSSIFKARCPACHEGPVLKNIFGIYPRCSVCGHDFCPEPGFYLGAMAVSFMLTAMLTVPPLIVLKLMGAEVGLLVAFPFIEFLFLGSFLMVYSRVCWLHLEYRMTTGLQGNYESHVAKKK
jgi:uncharacterized protein (DUF983 family)